MEYLGYFAAFLVFLTFTMRTMQPLRIMAMVSNVAFLAYAIPLQLWPVVVLHGVLLPLNALRLFQLRRMLRYIHSARVQDLDILKLVPHLRHEEHPAGTVLFQSGDPADCAYYIGAGEVTLPELGLRLPAGRFFGEVGVFSSAQLRTASAVCSTATKLYRISDNDLVVAFHRDPALALALVRLVTDRMEQHRAQAVTALARPTVRHHDAAREQRVSMRHAAA